MNEPNRTRAPGGFGAWRDDAWWLTLALVVLALLPRLYVAIAWTREPVWDGHYYHFGATRIAEGLGYSEDIVIGGQLRWNPWCHYPVGYSALLAVVYVVFGTSILVAPIVNAVIGALTVLVVHRIARYYLSEARSAVAGLIAAVHPGLVAYTAVVMTEPSAALFALAAGWCALQSRRGRGGLPPEASLSSTGDGEAWWRRMSGAPLVSVVGTALLVGIGALIRPPTLLAVPLLLWVFPRPFKSALLRSVGVGAVSLLVILPWTIRNCRVMDGCALISTNGGWNLAIGALTTTGRFTTLTAADGCPVVTGQVQQDRCWAGVGRRAIAQNPGRWLSVVPDKLRHTYNHESFPIEYLREANPEAWPEERRAAGRNLLTVFHHVLMFAALLGCIGWVNPLRLRGSDPSVRTGAALQYALLGAALGFAYYASELPEQPLFWFVVALPVVGALRLPGGSWQGPAGSYLLGLVFATTFTHAMFFGDDRYHIVVSPVLCVLAAAALRPPRDRMASSPPAFFPSVGS